MIDPISGVARELIGVEEYKDALATGSLITDDRRRRPLWFDGRFLDAAALNSEQNYILGRQADIAQVAGVGVVRGLFVDRSEGKARKVTIEAGHGVTPAGGLVMINDDIEIDLANVPEIQKLDVSFGLSKIPKQIASNRSGLFILALRPVEYSGHPITAYPTTIDGARSVEDGHIIEATAITLIPYPDQSSRLELNERRRHVAREIFHDGSSKAQPTGVLPLAMIALNQGVIQWLDVFMVRREVGGLSHDVLGLGLSPRAMQEAHLRQYHNHLSEILTLNSTGRMNASEHFASLPAAGPMPATSVNTNDFSQSFFPSEMQVDLSIIAEDELPALIEDSYVLPALDLNLGSDALESTSVLVVIPVPRNRLRKYSLSLKSLQRRLIPSAPGPISKRKPIDALTAMGNSAKLTLPIANTPDESEWQQLIQSVETLWYIRRRNISYRDDVVATAIRLRRDELQIESKVSERFKTLDLSTMIGNIKRRGSSAAEAEIVNLFSSSVFLKGSDISVKAAVNEINKLENVDRESVLSISERFTRENFGEGVSKLETANPAFASSKKKLGLLVDSGKLPELDLIAKALTPKEFEKFSAELTKSTTGSDASSDKVVILVNNKIEALKTNPITLASGRQLKSDLLVSGRKREF
jgi:hypothetical protein